MHKQLDFLSPKITLFYKGFDRHSSSISVIISISVYLTILILGIIFSMDFLFKKNPTTYFYNRFIYDVGTFSFNNTGIFHFIRTGEINNISYDNRVISVIGINDFDSFINKDSNITLYNHWIYEPCNNQHIGDLKKYLNDYETSFYNGLCINKLYNKTTKEIINLNDQNFKYPTIEHGNSNQNVTTYGIILLRCQNHSELNKTNCFDKDISDEKAIEVYTISMYFIDQYIDVTNYHNPLEKFYNKINNQIVLSSYTVNHLNFKPLKLNTHNGIIFNTNYELNFFHFDVDEKLIIEEANTGIYGAFCFWMQNQLQIYDRTYQKIQDISASISGISKLLTIIGYCINYLFAKFTLINDLSNDILKKTDKFGIKTSTQGFKILKHSTIKNNNELSYQFNNQKNILKNKRENHNSISPLYNNMIDDNISKTNLKESIIVKKNIKLTKINIKQILYFYICCFKNNNINKIETIRKKVLSEEKLFTFYFVLGSLSNNILKLNQEISKESYTNLKKNKIWIPQQNIYELGKNIN